MVSGYLDFKSFQLLSNWTHPKALGMFVFFFFYQRPAALSQDIYLSCLSLTCLKFSTGSWEDCRFTSHFFVLVIGGYKETQETAMCGVCARYPCSCGILAAVIGWSRIWVLPVVFHIPTMGCFTRPWFHNVAHVWFNAFPVWRCHFCSLDHDFACFNSASLLVDKHFHWFLAHIIILVAWISMIAGSTRCWAPGLNKAAQEGGSTLIADDRSKSTFFGGARGHPLEISFTAMDNVWTWSILFASVPIKDDVFPQRTVNAQESQEGNPLNSASAWHLARLKPPYLEAF